MQAELFRSDPDTTIRIASVNAIGSEAGYGYVAQEGTIPLVQDTDAAGVWDAWGVEYRDVVVLDAANRVAAVYNLSAHDLSNSGNYAELRKILRDAE
jgi:hypothetical protein